MGPVTYIDITGAAIRTAQSETSETAQLAVASTVGEHLTVGVPTTIGYFLVGALVPVAGFIVLDLITLGELHDLVFPGNRADVAMMAGSQQIALACTVVSVIRASDDDPMMRLGETLVYDALGVVLQTASSLVLEALTPGCSRDVVTDAKVHPRAMLTITTFIVIDVTNAVALSQMETITTSRHWWALLPGSVAACVACGLVYELALLALLASLGRDDVVANSLIVAGHIAALDFGAVAAKPFVCRAVVSFLGIKYTLGLFGGTSITALCWAFSVTGESLGVLVAATFIIRTLIDAEVPLFMTLPRIGQTPPAEDTGRVLANLNAADYFGALVGGLTWPFVLLPMVGIPKATAIAGLINITTALIAAALLLKQMLSHRALVTSVATLVAALVGLIALLAGIRDTKAAAWQSLYVQSIVFAKHLKYQNIAVT